MQEFLNFLHSPLTFPTPRNRGKVTETDCLVSVRMSTTTTPTFHSTWLQFCEDLEGTFPELRANLASCKMLDAPSSLAAFRKLWRPHLLTIATRDASLFTETGIGAEVLPGVQISRRLWEEVSAGTHVAIWNYLNSLALLSASEATAEDADSFWDEAAFKKGMEEMIRGLKDAAGAGEGAGSGGVGEGAGADAAAGNPFAAMGGLFEKLRTMAEGFGGAADAGEGAAGAGSGMPNIKIPERLFKGHIAKMAKELAEEFKPEDFGIDPAMLEVKDPAKIFEFLQEIFTKKPDLLMSAAQRIAKKIQGKFQRGEIRREEIMSEIEELMKEFSENEAFTSLFGQLGEVLGSTAKATGNEGSERRRQVQERLRKKQAEKEAKRTGTHLVVHDPAAVARAEAAARALLELEDSHVHTNGQKKKAGRS